MKTKSPNLALGDPVKGEGSQKLTDLPRAQRQRRAIIIVTVIQIHAKALGEHGYIVCRSENLSREGVLKHFAALTPCNYLPSLKMRVKLSHICHCERSEAISSSGMEIASSLRSSQ